MLRNCFMAAWRHLMRHRVYAAINLTGLSVGIAFCLLASLRNPVDSLRYE